MCGKQSAFELVSIITIYFGVFMEKYVVSLWRRDDLQ